MSGRPIKQLTLFQSEPLGWRTEADENAFEKSCASEQLSCESEQVCRCGLLKRRWLWAAVSFVAANAAGLGLAETANYIRAMLWQ